MEKIAVIIRGPAGVGKSSLSQILHEKIFNSAHIDIDLLKRMMSHDSSDTRTSVAHTVTLFFIGELAAKGYNIIVEEIFKEIHLIPTKELLEKLGYRVLIVFLTAPLPQLIERDHCREIKEKGAGVISRLHKEIRPGKEDIIIDTAENSLDKSVESILAYLAHLDGE